jgi:hypothetical protein
MSAHSENRPDAAESLTPSNSPQVIYVQPARSQPVLWIIAGLLAAIAVVLVFRGDGGSPLNVALAQPALSPRGGLEGGRGIYAFTGQLNARSYGLFMLDVDSGTVWCYEIQSVGAKGETRLSLVAARSWLFDRYLEEFNTGDPIPSEVREMVQQQRNNKSPASRPAGRTGSDNTPSATIEQ